MKTNISLRTIAVLLSIAVLTPSIVSCTDDEELVDLAIPESTVAVPAEEWDILGPTSFEKVGPDASTAAQMAQINEKYDFNMRNVSCSYNGRRKVAGTLTASAVGSMIAKTALDQVKNYAKSYAKKKVTGFAKKLFGIQDKPDPTMEKLNEIKSQLNDIDSKLDEMTMVLLSVDDKADNIYSYLLEDTYKDFNLRRMQLAQYNGKYISRIAYEVEKEVTDSTETEARITDILSMWAKGSVNGNEAYNETICYAKDMCQFNVTISAGDNKGSSMNLCTLYDKIVYDSFPWENLGYESREQFRALQSMQTIQALELAYLYCCAMTNCDNADAAYYESQKGMIENAIQNVAKFFELNEIQYHNDKAICQIKGSHFEMNLKGSIQPHAALTWKDGKPCAMKDTEIPFLSGVRSSSMSDQELKDIKAHYLTQDDASRMRTYFNNFLGKKTGPRDWFTLAGIDMTPFSDWSHIVTSDSYTSIYYYRPFGSFQYDIRNDNIHILFQNLLSVDANPRCYLKDYDWSLSNRLDHNFTRDIRYDDVEKKNEYKTSEAEKAWHTIKIKNSTGFTFDSNLLTLTLNRL